MKKYTCAILIASMNLSALAQVHCETTPYGVTKCSNGMVGTANSVGQTEWSNGVVGTQDGNRTNYSNGTTAIQNGNQINYSNGKSCINNNGNISCR